MAVPETYYDLLGMKPAKLDEPGLNIPLGELGYPFGVGAKRGPQFRQPHYPVVCAFRLTGLVRGPRPYVPVTDDARKDVKAHRFQWNMQLPDDAVLCRENRTYLFRRFCQRCDPRFERPQG